ISQQRVSWGLIYAGRRLDLRDEVIKGVTPRPPADPVRFWNGPAGLTILTAVGGPLLPTTSMMHGRFPMKRVTLALATLLFAFAVIPSADARVVQPPWVVVRWSYGDCKIWRNDTGPWYPGWQAGAYANTYPEAWAKMQALYGRRWCV